MAQTKADNKIRFIAHMQVIAIVMVVLYHSFHEYPDGENGATLFVFRLLYSVHVQTFMFVSGYLLALTSYVRGNAGSKSLTAFVAGKTRRLLLPFVVLTAITFVPRAMMSAMADDAIELSWSSFWQAFVFQDHLVIPFFWYLHASFILLVAGFFFIKLGIKAGRTPAETVAVFFLIAVTIYFFIVEMGYLLSLREVARMGIYFVAGMFYCLYQPVVDRKINWSSTWLLCSAAAVWIMLFMLTDGTPWVCFCSLAGIMTVMSLARFMEARNIRFADHLFGATYMIFLLSWYFNILSQQILAHFVELPWWVHTVLSLLLGIYGPWLFNHILERKNISLPG